MPARLIPARPRPVGSRPARPARPHPTHATRPHPLRAALSRTTRAARPGRWSAVLPGALLAVLVLAGCGDLTGPAVDGRAQLIDDLAARLARAAGLTYTASYRMPGGSSATIAQAQRPARAAYGYPAGKLVVTADQVLDCRTGSAGTVCRRSAPPSPAADPASTLLGQLSQRGLVDPTAVAALLSTAALDSATVIEQHDTTLAGENASCVRVAGGPDNTAAFSVCILTAGLLGSFVGTVDGTAVDITLDRYAPTVAPDAFDAPAGARISGGR